MGQIIYREYIVFRGSNISCSLASRIDVLLCDLVSSSNTVLGHLVLTQYKEVVKY